MDVTEGPQLAEGEKTGAQGHSHMTAGQGRPWRLESPINPSHDGEEHPPLNRLRINVGRGQAVDFRRRSIALEWIKENSRPNHRHKDVNDIANVKEERHDRDVVK